MKAKKREKRIGHRTEMHKHKPAEKRDINLGMSLAVTCFMLLFVGIGDVSATVTNDETKILITNGAETLTTINDALNDTSLLEQLSAKEWLLNVPIQVQASGSFYVNDSDCDWLKLRSMNDGNEAYIGDYGLLEIKNTKITGWDTTVNDVAYMSIYICKWGIGYNEYL